MSKARDLADFISTGSIFTDGAIASTEITGVTADASEINKLDGVTASTAEINKLTGVTASTAELNKLDGLNASTAELNNVVGSTSALQTQLDNISVTSGSLTKTFTQNETADITLSQSITSGCPVVSATKEVPQSGVSSKGNWDVNSTASNYDFHDTATNVTLTPSTSTDLASSTYASVSLAVTGSYGPRFSSDGTKLFQNNQGQNYIRQSTLSTPWDISTRTSVASFSTASQVNDETGFCFSDNGLHFYLCDQNGSGSNMLHQYSINSSYPYDLLNYGSFTRTVNMTSLGEAAPATRMITSVLVEDSGTKMYIFSGSGSSALIRQYTLSTAYDISSATYANKSFDVYADYGSGGYLGNSSLSSDGTLLLLANGADDIVMQYQLSTAWDISTASRVGTYNPSEDANVGGIHLRPNNSEFFMKGGSTGNIYKYTLGSSPSLTLGSGSFASTDVGKRIVGNGGDVILTATSGTYSTTGGSAFTDNSTIAAGSWSMFGLKSAGDADGITVAGITNDYDIANASNIQTYSGTASYMDAPRGIYVKSDGTSFYYVDYDSTRRRAYQFNMSTPHDLSTASYSASMDISSQDTIPMDIRFKPDGTKFYIVGNNLDRIFQYSLSTAWDLTTGSYESKYKGTGHSDSQSCFFKTDGTQLYTYGTDGVVYQHTMSTAWDVSTAGSAVGSKNIGSVNGAGDGTITFSDDGTKLFFGRTADATVYQWNLSTAWDITTATSSGISFSVSNDITTFYGLYIHSGLYLYALDYSPRDINRYNIGSITQPTGQYHVGVTNAGGQIDSQYFTDINSMTAAESAGTGTAHYAVSTDGKTTWSVAKGTDGVRPIVRNNSGTWQYNNDGGTSSSNDLSVAAYNSNFIDISANLGSGNAYSSFWSNDGTQVFLQRGSNLANYNLSTAYDLTTASYVTYSNALGSQDNVPFSIWMNSTGERLYMCGGASDTIYQYSLSTANNLSTLSYTGNSINVQAQDTENRGVWLGPENASNVPTKMFMTGGATQTVYEYGFTTAGNLSTASYSNVSFSVASQQGDTSGLAFSSDGTRMFILGRSPKGVHQYNLSTAWDISTASYSNLFYSTSPTVTTPHSMTLSSNGEHLLIGDESGSNYFFSFSVGGASYGTSTTWVNGTTNDELYTLQEALGAQAFNRMDKTQLDAVADANHFTLGNSLDLMIALRMDTAASTLPTSDGVTLNYDAAALNEGAVLGTDYDFFFPANNKVQIKSLAAQNLKVRVV